MLSSREILGVFKPGDHGSTFGGNPLASAIARTALKVLIEEDLIDNAQQQGTYMMERLQEINSPHIAEIRGKGLMIGIELKPSSGGARVFAEKLMQHGILCKETHQKVLRFTPPLVISRSEMDWALERIEKVLVNR
jgi:ornithine--oxo-acid transaminase